jgi:RNA polymerase sigma-70 factor (ECF subfamily)
MVSTMGTDAALAAHSLPISDPREFSRIYEQHSAAVLATARTIVGDITAAQDVAHDVFLALWLAPDRFDAARAGLGSYLRLLTRSRALDVARRNAAHVRARARLAHAGMPVAAPPSDAVEQAERRAAVREAIDLLPAEQRAALHGVYWRSMTAAEVAAETGAPLGTTKSRIRLGMSSLRGALAHVR